MNYTSIEQSKKLLELGLDPNTADMYYERTEEDPEFKPFVGANVAVKFNLFSFRNGHVIPCWSIEALLKLMPKYRNYYPYIKRTPRHGHQYYISYPSSQNDFVESGAHDDLIDACYEMIVWLLKNNYIKK